MQILIFSWKDVTHPQAGGAEIVTLQFAKNLLKQGCSVTIFTTLYPQAKKAQLIDGVKIIRQGNSLSVYLKAFFYYQSVKENTDLVIDQIHGIPFFTPLYVRKPILGHIFEVAGEIWFKQFPLPLAAIGFLFEQFYFSLYKQTPFLTHSVSTVNELTQKGITKKLITCLPLNTTQRTSKTISKNPIPTLLYIGRLAPIKQVELLIKAAMLIAPELPKLSVNIIGTGKDTYVQFLKNLVNELKLTRTVRFYGSVSEKKKQTLLQKSWLHIHPSAKEGFGLTVIEAAKAGTPTLCFNVPGLKELVINGRNGYIIENQTYVDLAKKISYFLQNKKLRTKLYKSTLGWSNQLPDAKKTSEKFAQLIKQLA